MQPNRLGNPFLSPEQQFDEFAPRVTTSKNSATQRSASSADATTSTSPARRICRHLTFRSEAREAGAPLAALSPYDEPQMHATIPALRRWGGD